MSIEGKHILIGITAGIAAYKIPLLIRRLIKGGAMVKIVLSPDADQFVTPLTLSTLSRNPVLSEFYDGGKTWNNHVELAAWADLLIIAPCTANTLAKMATGICDNLLMAVYLSAKCPVFVAPAMDLDMYAHPITVANLAKVKGWPHHYVIPAEEGELASGLHGQGRMAEPETIAAMIKNFLEGGDEKALFSGKRFLITAGPTYENIDPVRFIGNYSSGKMGFALAEAVAKHGGKVILISGPSVLNIAHPAIDLIRVTSAREMYEKVFEFYSGVDVAIMSAAVADYAPKYPVNQKIKKKEDHLMIELQKNPDILKDMGAKKSSQILVGFALETQDGKHYAQQKLQAKNLDLIVLNTLEDKGAGFRKDTNKVTIFSKKGDEKVFTLKTKAEVAEDILNEVKDCLK